MPTWRCVYCGAIGALTCEKHRDLPELDRDWWARRPTRRYRSFWLERFTGQEIVELAHALSDPERGLVAA